MIVEKKALSFNGYTALLCLIAATIGGVFLVGGNTVPINGFEFANILLFIVILICWGAFSWFNPTKVKY
jgi:hypothetical protein